MSCVCYGSNFTLSDITTLVNKKQHNLYFIENADLISPKLLKDILEKHSSKQSNNDDITASIEIYSHFSYNLINNLDLLKSRQVIITCVNYDEFMNFYSCFTDDFRQITVFYRLSRFINEPQELKSFLTLAYSYYNDGCNFSDQYLVNIKFSVDSYCYYEDMIKIDILKHKEASSNHNNVLVDNSDSRTNKGSSIIQTYTTNHLIITTLMNNALTQCQLEINKSNFLVYKTSCDLLYEFLTCLSNRINFKLRVVKPDNLFGKFQGFQERAFSEFLDSIIKDKSSIISFMDFNSINRKLMYNLKRFIYSLDVILKDRNSAEKYVIFIHTTNNIHLQNLIELNLIPLNLTIGDFEALVRMCVSQFDQNFCMTPRLLEEIFNKVCSSHASSSMTFKRLHQFITSFKMAMIKLELKKEKSDNMVILDKIETALVTTIQNID